MRMRMRSTPRSRSMDLTGLSFSPLRDQQDPDARSKPQAQRSPIGGEQEEQGERFVLSSQRFRGNENDKTINNASTLQAVVRRAFSLRKSNSVGDGYWRIHDTGDADGDGDAAVIQEEEEEERPTRIKKKGKLFRACKRLFKFST